MGRKIEIYDTSLRDGLQGEKIKLNLHDKLEAVQALDSLGVDYIEGGFPLASDNEEVFFKKVASIKLNHSKIAAFGSTRKPGGNAKQDAHMSALLSAETPVVTVVGKSWTKHVEEVILTTRQENLEMIRDSISYLKSEGREIIYDAEHFFDGFQDDREYAISTIKAARDAGADKIILCDTNGGTTYKKFFDTLKEVQRLEDFPFGVHLHDDTGCAVANSIYALDYGAIQIQGTINGWGERCGNANLTVIIPNIFFKTDFECVDAGQIKHLTYVSRMFDELANLTSLSKLAYTGKSAFAHKAGQHADVILKNPELMEHIDAELVGNSRRVLLSELAGKATIAYKLSRFGEYDKNTDEVKNLTRLLKEKEQLGYEYESAEASFDLLIRKELNIYEPFFELIDYGTIVEHNAIKMPDVDEKGGKNYIDMVRAHVRLKVDGEEYSGIANSQGPVGALDAALRKALLPKYPFVSDVVLSDYKVRVLNSEQASEAMVSVHITSKSKKKDWSLKNWTTVGVSANIIEASWLALIDSLEYAYNEKKDLVK